MGNGRGGTIVKHVEEEKMRVRDNVMVSGVIEHDRR